MNIKPFGVDFSKLPDFSGWGSQQEPESTTRGTLYSADKDKILERQRGKCAGKNCAKRHGKRMPVNIRSNFDHIKPLALRGKDITSNIQALCANCHQEKTREDRKAIAKAKNGSGRTKQPPEHGIFGQPIIKLPKNWP
ncbi:HNH endonuclease [Candidatus Woesearchaeota archaeon]|nr:HNH endonuclease [Candidatus Woesearchaeota archaeon]